MNDKKTRASNKNALKNNNTSERIKEIINKNSKVLLVALLAMLLIIVLVYFLINTQSSKLSMKPEKSPSINVPTPVSTSTSALAPTAKPTPTPSPSPTPVPLVQGPQTYGISSKGIPQMYDVSFNTIDPKQTTQTVKLKVKDQSGNVNSVSATVKTDNLSKNYNLSLSAGTASDGEWTGSWTLSDTYNKNFTITFSATDDKGNKSSVDLTIR